jgi:hypothetical protein
MRTEGLPPWTVYVDAETGDTLKEVRGTLMPKGLGEIEMAVEFGDFRPVKGLRVPFRQVLIHEAMGKVVTQFHAMETKVELDDDTFVLHRGGEGPEAAPPPEPVRRVRRGVGRLGR